MCILFPLMESVKMCARTAEYEEELGTERGERATTSTTGRCFHSAASNCASQSSLPLSVKGFSSQPRAEIIKSVLGYAKIVHPLGRNYCVTPFRCSNVLPDAAGNSPGSVRHSSEDPGSNPAFLCGVCRFSLCLRRFSLGTSVFLQHYKNMHDINEDLRPEGQELEPPHVKEEVEDGEVHHTKEEEKLEPTPIKKNLVSL
ncbi:uncharacterized protein LOC133398153 isoform X2 [Phycodurus eques]|uniref:uncharacterized protein LOC133398153 isoform X2 n=1 Tax=Phycodurus eques TaxID=693459 RepID=UPI002ACEB84F|nr:uncharacterized protein LOC133398153 isoform X2 [Phycodurus eques]